MSRNCPAHYPAVPYQIMDIFEEAQQVRGYEEQSIKAMCLYAAAHPSKSDRKAIKAAWDCDPRPYARAVDMMPGWFGTDYTVSKFELLSLIKIASVRNKFARALLAEEWKRLTLSFDDVRARVDEVNKPKPREKQDKSAALKDAREIIELLTEIGIEWDDVENAMSMANDWMDKYGGKT